MCSPWKRRRGRAREQKIFWNTFSRRQLFILERGGRRRMRRSTLSSLHPSHCSDQEVQCLLLLCFCESIIDKGPRPECVFTQSAAISGVARWAVLLFAAISASARRARLVLWPAPVRRERIRRRRWTRSSLCPCCVCNVDATRLAASGAGAIKSHKSSTSSLYRLQTLKKSQNSSGNLK